MLTMNDDAAIRSSIEIAKILCSAHGDRLTIDADGANEIADFIETLENRLTCKDPDNC